MESHPESSQFPESLQFLEEEIDKRLRFFKERNKGNRRWALIFAVLPAGLSASATVAIALSDRLEFTNLLVVAIIATSLATVFSAWESLFSNRKLWLVAGIAIGELHALKSQIEYEKVKSASIEQKRVDQLHETFKQIIMKSEIGWASTVSE